MDISEQNINTIGEVAESIESCVCTLALPVDNEIHVKALRALLPDFVEQLKSVYIETTGENPWE